MKLKYVQLRADKSRTATPKTRKNNTLNHPLLIISAEDKHMQQKAPNTSPHSPGDEYEEKW